MTCSLRLARLVSAGAIPIVLFACGGSPHTRDASTATGSGGSTAEVGETDAPGSGGGVATGGVQTGGAQGSGGELGAGGRRAEAGVAGGGPGSGGESRSGGSSGAAGSTGGTTIGLGGASGPGGATTTGGKTAGSGGLSGPGGSSTGGHTTGSGGTPSDGGSSGVDGSAGTVPLPPKFFGNIDTYNSIRSDFASMWDQFTPETAGKWESVQPSRSTFNWTTLDAMYKYCDENHIIFKEHAFIWGNAGAGWMTSATVATAAPAWMKAFCDRYPKARIIDVVNEPIHMTPSFVEGLGGRGTSGYDWVAQSFKWAREACPNAVLVLNDYNIIEYESDHKKFIQLVKAMQETNAPIMAIGAEAHDAYRFSGSTIAASIADIASQTGLPLYVTELDIGVMDDSEQATIMQDLVTTFWNDPNVLGITYWGYIVGRTWRSNTGLMQDDGTRRPALTWLMGFLGR